MSRYWLVLILFSCSQVFANEVITFANADQEYHYNLLIKELRCAVCQNQNLADSHAELAKDMRDIVLEMINQGKSDQEIKAFMVARYGNFVLYRPPMDRMTMFLWFAPLVLLLLAIWVVVRLVKKRQAASAVTVVSADEQTEIERLLANQQDNKTADQQKGDRP